MKTRFSSLVAIKKNSMQKSERVVQKANQNLTNAQEALEKSLRELQTITNPTTGNMAQFLANRSLIEAQRVVIAHNQEWVSFAKKELLEAQEALKNAMIEYEKFKYLELQEIEKIIKEQKLQEAKNLDEVALMTHTKKTKMKYAS